MALSVSEKANGVAAHPTQTRDVLDPTLIAESSSQILQRSRQTLAPKVHYSLLGDSARPQLFDANGRPTNFTSRASYKYHNGKLSVKRQKTRPATRTEPSAAPTNSELLAIAHDDESDTDADGEKDWEVCDYDFTASPAVQLSLGRRTELTGVRRSIPFLASLSGARKLSPPTPSTRPPTPEMQQTSEPKTSPVAAEVTPLTSEPRAVIHPPPELPPLLPATQESELTELGESEGLLYDYRLVPQRHAAAVAEARVSVQTKKGAIKRAATPAAKAPYDQKGRSGRGNWTLQEEIDLVRFILQDAGKVEWDKKGDQLLKRLPLGRSLDEVKTRWNELLSCLNGPSAHPELATATTWSLDEDQKILSFVIDYTQPYTRAALFGKLQGHETRSPAAFGSK